MSEVTSRYRYTSAGPSWSNNYLWRPLLKVLTDRLKPGDSILDVGCGSGATAGMLAKRGYQLVGIDPSESGIALAEEAFPDVRFAQRSAYDDLAGEYGQFDAIVSLEVVEHCFSPRVYAANLYSATKPGGIVVISTPYHGYWKNLALALAGKFDFHFSPLWDGGHIKFWSAKTITSLLKEAGFVDIRIQRIGRIPPLAKSMLIVAKRHVRKADEASIGATP
ncbi:MAG: class I SAM-dependent methyltransferase [Rhodanobacteraceae bacterium]|nr:class I SAM-dependent methyltransferase [Rhodanobacteraceae bacterium]